MNEVLIALEADGLITRSPAANHGRVVEVALSRQGPRRPQGLRPRGHPHGERDARRPRRRRPRTAPRGARQLRLPPRRGLRPALDATQVAEYSRPPRRSASDTGLTESGLLIRCRTRRREVWWELPSRRVTTKTVLDVRDLHVSYAGAVHALKGVSLAVAEGEVLAVLGANGAGKSTLLRALSGTLRPAAGHDRRSPAASLVGRDPADIARAGLVQVPEGRRIFAELTVEENLRAGALAAKAQAREARAVGRRAVPDPQRAPDPARRPALRRRAADARDRPRADGQPEAADPGRTLARPRAADRRPVARGDRRDQPPRRDRRARRAERGDGARGRRPRGRARGGGGRARGRRRGTRRERGHPARATSAPRPAKTAAARSRATASASRSTASPCASAASTRSPRSPSPSSRARCTR